MLSVSRIHIRYIAVLAIADACSPQQRIIKDVQLVTGSNGVSPNLTRFTCSEPPKIRREAIPSKRNSRSAPLDTRQTGCKLPLATQYYCNLPCKHQSPHRRRENMDAEETPGIDSQCPPPFGTIQSTDCVLLVETILGIGINLVA